MDWTDIEKKRYYARAYNFAIKNGFHILKNYDSSNRFGKPNGRKGKIYKKRSEEERLLRFKESRKKTIEKNRDKERLRKSNYCKTHRDSINERNRNNRKNNRERFILRDRERSLRDRENLCNAYVKRVLNVSDPPYELIELKRIQLKIKREIKSIN